MNLAARFSLTFGLIASLATLGLGLVVRTSWLESEEKRFDDELTPACQHLNAWVETEMDRDHKLLARSCAHGSLVDRANIAKTMGGLDGQRLALFELVRADKSAFGFDELALVTSEGEVIGAEPKNILQVPGPAIAKLGTLHPRLSPTSIAGNSDASILLHCRSASDRGWIGLTGTRKLQPLVDRFAESSNLKTAPYGSDRHFGNGFAVRACKVGEFTFPIAKSKASLDQAIRLIDERVVGASILATLAALLASIVLARGLARPISRLAAEAQLVAEGTAKPVVVGGAKEIRDLGAAFSRMLQDLTQAKTRLQAASRVAAWREVAKRVAHEIKNPLAPIRAAVETLRRLRARNDPAFDEYFDEASRTVLDEVQRIATIASEFSHFARLPAPRPTKTDLRKLMDDQVRLQEATGGVRMESSGPPALEAEVDREQIAQVLTNLLKNAREASKADPNIRISLQSDGSSARLRVEDNGAGVPQDMEPRLFEPYATSKASGTGLGLAISQRIAMDHDGSLNYLGRASDRAPYGAVFELVLPLAGPKVVPVPSTREPERS